MKTLYPEIEPYRIHNISVDGLHRIYVEECGNPAGIPVIYLHGGPASGCKPDHRRFFDPKIFRVFLFDQRGCGRCKPYGELKDNTTQDLVADIEHFRTLFGIEKWLLFGGSWGATLSLLYAQHYPDNVSAMILRGVFLARSQDFEWFSREGANKIYPEQWSRLISAVPNLNETDLISAIDSSLWEADELTQLRVAKEWDAWGAQVALGKIFDPENLEEPVPTELLLRVRMETHYAKHQYFITENQVLENCTLLQDIPTVIIHGRNDLVCPMESAYSLHLKLPRAEFIVLPDSGHIAQGDEMVGTLIRATDRIVEQTIQ